MLLSVGGESPSDPRIHGDIKFEEFFTSSSPDASANHPAAHGTVQTQPEEREAARCVFTEARTGGNGKPRSFP